MKFRHRPIEVDVTQWFNAGDHPAEVAVNPMQAYMHTALVIPNCGQAGHTQDLHPGDYIVTHADGRHEVLSNEELRRRFEPVPLTDVHWHPVH